MHSDCLRACAACADGKVWCPSCLFHHVSLHPVSQPLTTTSDAESPEDNQADGSGIPVAKDELTGATWIFLRDIVIREELGVSLGVGGLQGRTKIHMANDIRRCRAARVRQVHDFRSVSGPEPKDLLATGISVESFQGVFGHLTLLPAAVKKSLWAIRILCHHWKVLRAWTRSVLS